MTERERGRDVVDVVDVVKTCFTYVYMCTYVYIYICTYTIYLTWLYVPHVYIFTRTSKQLDVYMYTYMYVHV